MNKLGSIALGLLFVTESAAADGDGTVLLLDGGANSDRALAAVDNLGLDRTVVTPTNALRNELMAGEWHLLVLDVPGLSIDPSTVQAIDAHVAGGGLAILSWWALDISPAMRDVFGVASLTDMFNPMQVHAWDTGHPIFLTPTPVPNVPILGDFWADNGDRLVAAAGATELGGFTPSTTNGEAAIILANDSRTIVNGFLYDDMQHAEVVALIENQITFLLQAYPPTVGTRYCTPAVPNSTGSPATIRAVGSCFVANADLTLIAEQLPPGEFGYFLVGSNQGSVQPPGSQGVLCLACGFTGCSGIGRYNQGGMIVQGPNGSLAIDFASLPLSPPVPIQVGETWNFQLWYRNLGSNNFTDAVSVTFQ
ncbi:MAG: hypothetical protein GY711_34035 [bacterium]|nr:hypothetical protein [bacterium]